MDTAKFWMGGLMKTVLAPGAPWYGNAEKSADIKDASPRLRRATSQEVTANFERWLDSVQKIKKGVKSGTRRRSI